MYIVELFVFKVIASMGSDHELAVRHGGLYINANSIAIALMIRIIIIIA